MPMTKEQVKHTVDKAKKLNAYDSIIITSDNGDIMYTKSESTVGYFNDKDEVFESFKINASPTRAIGRQFDRNLTYEVMPYADIVSIEFFPGKMDCMNNMDQFGDMPKEMVEQIIQVGSAQFKATGFLRDKKTGDVKPATSRPTLTLGTYEEPSEKLYPNKDKE